MRSILILLLTATTSFAEDFVPKVTEFPPAGTGVHLSGELVAVDHVNRRGALRLDGDGVDDRYHWAPSHRFALLPYGTIRYHGAPAELRDIPLGTHLHGLFCLPPENDNVIPPADKNAEKYVPKQNHVLLLEDDFSFHERNGRSWKITGVDRAKGKLKATLLGEPVPEGMKRDQTFDLDDSTRVWKGRQSGSLDELTPETIVQFNFGWAPDWLNGQLHAIDVWLDQESRDTVRAQQRAVHLRYERIRGLPALIDHVEHEPGGKGVVTITFFGGRDATLYEGLQVNRGIRLAAAEPTLRTWWQEHDNKYGQILERKQLEPPPPGSSGIQVRVRISELLEGFRPGRIVRVCQGEWPRIKLPPEERVKDVNDR